VFIERKAGPSVSIERVFRQVAEELGDKEFEIKFQAVPYGNGLLAIIRNLLSFRPEPADAYHITGDIHYVAIRLPRRRTVLTIHDLIFIRRRTGFRRWVLKKLFLDIPVRRAGVVTTVSESTADEIEVIHGFRPRVIENSLLDGFEPYAEGGNFPPVPTILHIGTAENKNLDGLIAAAAGTSWRIRIVGRLSQNQLTALAANGINYDNVYGLTERDVVDEYRKADIVFFASTYEGFGLPILEAQAMRKPIVTSDLEPMRSVAGDGAALVDPTDPASIRTAIQRIVSDAAYREELIRLGESNVKRFPASKAAAAYAEIYRDISRANSATL
jgi:glycosyltransferase involved in cell wall biosynthesis